MTRRILSAESTRAATPDVLALQDAASAMRGGTLTSVALANAYFTRIRGLEPRIHAWAWIDETRALECAAAADRARRAESGELHGMPIGVKDVILTAGIPTSMGSPIYADYVPTASAACIEKLQHAGAFVQGKTVTTEFATRHPGPTANPWNAAFTPGGSSSGSAAAVAAGFTAAAIGTQTVGSIIRPAAYCGVVGFKPTFGVVSRFGVRQVSGTLDHVGVLARTVDDAGIVVAAMQGHDPRDAATLDEGQQPVGLQQLDDLASAPRLAAVRSAFWPLADRHQQAMFHANCAALREAGAVVDDVALDVRFDAAVDIVRTIQAVEVALNFEDLLARDAERTSAAFRALCARGARTSGVDYRKALDQRVELGSMLAEVAQPYDAIVSVPATGEAPASLDDTGNANFCATWSLCGVPSVAIPSGLGPHGLPMGLQIVGALRDDRRTLQVAKWCARHLHFNHAPEL